MTSQPTPSIDPPIEPARRPSSSDVTSTPRVTEARSGGLARLIDELRWRGRLHAFSDGLPARLASGRLIAGYNGFDPTGPSLHIGHLVPIFGLLHLQRHGGRPVVVVGGGTGMIGDPSGRSSERNLLDRETLATNAVSIRAQLERFLDFTPGPAGAVMVNNIDWLAEISMVDFLRDVGKHFTIPYMLDKDSVQLRLSRGLTYTEFSYMLLQAYDFLHLYRTLGVEMQMGGADQWGNITAGLELIRRVEGAGEEAEAAHALCYPLLTNASGEKFGKTAEGTSIWLDRERTSPFEFYQYWVNAADADVGQYLRWFTLFEREAIESLEAELTARPESRAAQRALALDLTARVHGRGEAEQAREVSEAVFDRTLPGKSPEVLAYAAEVLPHQTLRTGDLNVAQLAVASGIAQSMGEARRAVTQGGFYVNEVRVTDPSAPLPRPLAERYYVLRHGKRSYRIVIADET